MKRQLLTLGLIIVGAISANSQTLVSENFNNINAWTPETSWAILDFNDSDRHWGIYSAGNFTDYGISTACAGSESFYENTAGEFVPYAVANMIISPEVALPTSGTNTQLNIQFKSAAALASSSSVRFEVFLFNDSGLEIDAYNYTHSTSTTTAQNHTVNLPITTEMSAEPLFVGFVHYGSVGVGYIAIDDVVISAVDPASVENFEQSGLAVYPNPATDVLNITSENHLIETISIVDLNGRVVKTVNGVKALESVVNISELSSGMYILNVTSNGVVSSKKIVKK